MTDPTTPAVDRIPLAHSVRYVARGLPEIPNQYGPGTLAPSEITLTYRTASDSQLGRVHAYVAGRLRVDGTEVPLLPGGLYGQHYDDGLDGWPAWLAEEARLHDPDAPAVPAGQAPATDRAALREAIRRAVCEAEGFAWDSDMLEPDEYGDHADAVLAALSVNTDRAGHDLATARATNRRLNLRAQRLESELAAYRRAVGQWEISDAHAYVPLRTLAAIAKAAGVAVPEQWELHYERVKRAEADRAAVLREEAALIRAHCPDHLDADSAEGAWMDCHCAVADDMEQRAASGAGVAATPDTEAACTECDHPKAAHGEGEDPVSPGRCADCPESGEEWHDYQPAVGALQPKEETQP